MVTPSNLQDTPTATDSRHDVVDATGRNKFRIPSDKIRQAISSLDETQRATVLWFAGYCRIYDLGKEELGRVLRKPGTNEYYSGDSITQLFTGGRIRRGENIEPILNAIEALRKIEGMREEQFSSGFVETRLFLEIEKRCLKALARRKILFIWGESQIGKTWALKETARRHNHGQTIYMEMPTGGSLGAFLKALAKALGLPGDLAHPVLVDRIIDSFDGNMLLICDEMHRCLSSRYSSGGLQVFSFIRELWNRCQCGIVLSLTNEGRDQFLKGPHSQALRQLWRRRISPLQLPNSPPDDDAALFARAYGLSYATEEPVSIRVSYIDTDGSRKTRDHVDQPLRLQRAVLAEEGLGVWVGILQEASDMAREQKRAITWGAVIKAHALSLAESEMLD